jgi:hypothetical protein
LLSSSYSKILETYTLEEILELSEVTEEECLEYLIESRFIKLPDILPVDL